MSPVLTSSDQHQESLKWAKWPVKWLRKMWWHCNVTSNVTITTYTLTTIVTIIYRQLMQGDWPRDYLPAALIWLLENVRTASAWSIILLCHILYSWRVLVFRTVILSLHMHDTACKTISSPQKDFFNKHLRYCLKDKGRFQSLDGSVSWTLYKDIKASYLLW